MAYSASSFQFGYVETTVPESDFKNLTMDEKHDGVCQPCSILMKTRVATLYCFDCDERFCEQCGSIHKQSKLSRGHRMCRQEEAPPSEAIEELKRLSTCTDHNEEYEYICIDHDALCCGKCVNTGHRRCRRLETISDHIKNESKRGNKLKTIIEKCIGLTKATDEILDTIESHKTSLRQSEAFAMQTFRTAKTKILSALEDLEQSFIVQISQQKAEIESEVRKNAREVDRIKRDINQNRKKSQIVVDYGRDVHKFQRFRNLKKSVIPQLTASTQRLKNSYQRKLLYCNKHMSLDELASDIKECLSVSTDIQARDGEMSSCYNNNWTR
ncbi:probable RING finger protein 207 homolog [Mya arenaria]|uniref:probable RING finger protein 207 homolog n=1 Tax=Mya arenaria TaxID=6604 RepID=UPI0022E50C17|nr:probable RING finger protein 207 homolog [Mya arenaria]